MNHSFSKTDSVKIIEPNVGWQALNLKELYDYKDLLIFLVWRNIKVLYAQTILGLSWALLEPLIQIVLFTVIFGNVAKIETDGIPFFLFSTVAIVPWSYISQVMAQSSESLVTYQSLLSKIYFPRLIFPLAPAFSKLIEFFISMLIVIFVLLYYRVIPNWNFLLFPFLILYMMGFVIGFGLWASAMAIRFRDVRRAMPFFIRIFMYSAPIIYPLSAIPEIYRVFYSLNPLVGIIEGFRSCFLGTPVPWYSIGVGFGVSIIFTIIGAMYFKRMERVFVDVI